MKVFHEIDAAHAASKALRREGHTLSLVPTMGALHEGHLSLVRAARERCDAVAATIFVNPTQFGPNEDFAQYPRTFDNDCRMLEREGVDLLFAPSSEAMYPPGISTWVDVPGIGGRLDGASRPGHFRGVATIVTKLLHILQPDTVFFGQKDAAQVAVLRAMLHDLNFDVAMIVCPTVREADGLAMSSRNRYLSPHERERAIALSRSLHAIEDRIAAGETDPQPLAASLRTMLTAAEGVRLEYVEIVDAQTLLPVEHVRAGTLVAVAAHVGSTRLIDNIVIQERSRP